MARLQVWDFTMGHKGYDGNSIDAWMSGPNSAGGVSVKFSFKNLTEKTIKYAHFWFTPYNAVNDGAPCSIKGKATDGVRYTGPLAPGEMSFGNIWENAWYNSTIRNVRLIKVYIEYMDGTDESVMASDIDFSVPEGVSTGGCCVVATCVYGSYDCPEVWTLRRFRDETLASTWYGRAFIRTYYAIGPTIVKWFGGTTWFKNMWKPVLDKMVSKLNSNGVEDTPYNDRPW